jgi:hypothetical protein
MTSLKSIKRGKGRLYRHIEKKAVRDAVSS